MDKDDLVRKRIGAPAGKTANERRRAAKMMIAEINALLVDGYVVGADEEEFEKAVKEKKPKATILEAIEKATEIKIAKSGEYGKRNYQSFFNVFSEWIKEEGLHRLGINQLTKAHVYAFVDYLRAEREIGAKTTINYITRLNSLCNELIEREILLENPTKGVKKPKATSGTHYVYTEEQQARLEDWLREHDPELYLFTRLIYYGFLRPVELCRMRVQHINLNRRSIVIPAELTKNHTQQGIYIVDPLMEDLEAAGLEKLHPNHYLFSKKLLPGEFRIPRKVATVRHRTALEETGLYDGKLTLYSWKHTGVCNAYQAGVDIKTLQSLLRGCLDFSLSAQTGLFVPCLRHFSSKYSRCSGSATRVFLEKFPCQTPKILRLVSKHQNLNSL